MKTWPTVFLLGCCLCCVLLTGEAQQAEKTLYGLVGGNVDLNPGNLSRPIISIIWKDGVNIAVDWEPYTEVSYKRHFKERSSLNTSTGVLTITGVDTLFSALYTPEISGIPGPKMNLIVISPVPVPTVEISCNNEKTTCTLKCDGNTTGAGPVIYTWKSDGTVIPSADSKEHIITNTTDNSSKEFSCVLNNTLSWKSSKPMPNPFLTDSTLSIQPKFNTGITVFICLVVPLLLLVFIHRMMAGMWFYEKASMPWEADFWRKNKTSRADEANGTAARQESEQTHVKMLTE